MLHGHGRTSIGWRGGGGSAGFEKYSREKGRRLVLVDANPPVNIRGTEKIWRVIKDGQPFDPGKLKEPAPRETIAES